MKYIYLFERFVYSLEDLENIAKNYDNVYDFRQTKFYNIASNRGKDFLKKITAHMTRKKVREFTDDELREIAKQYNTKVDFMLGNLAAYKIAVKNKPFFDDITKHMQKAEPIEPHNYSNNELREIAKKYNNKTDFLKNDFYAYHSAKKRTDKNFFKDITSHMDQAKRYTDEELMDIAKKYKVKKDFMKSDYGAYQTALKRGPKFYNNITSHMRTDWNLFDITEETKRWNNINDFAINSPGAYNYLLKHPQLFSKLTAHMSK